LKQSNAVSRLGLQYIKGQTEVLVTGNNAVIKECDRLDSQTKILHESNLQNTSILENLRKTQENDLFLSL